MSLSLGLREASAATFTALYNSAADVPVTANGYTATGNTVSFTLNFAPAVGTDLLVVNNTGLDFINGTFDNLAQGQTVWLSYGGTNYNFIANYNGGSGNDLVLVWANSRVYGWGNNNEWELGDNTTLLRTTPVAMDIVDSPALFFGKPMGTLGAGYAFSLALALDGTLAAWGDNEAAAVGVTNSIGPTRLPASVNRTPDLSALYGKRVVAISAGVYHSLALCSDGTIAAWGDNSYGRLGTNAYGLAFLPVSVDTSAGVSALSGKSASAISAGQDHSLALCSDGTVVAWGRNGFGQLGDNTTTNRLTAVVVNTTEGSALSGKTVVAIAAGDNHSLALCSDGTVAAWGENNYGQLGDNTTTNRLVPVLVNTDSGVSALYGKTVVAIAAADSHSVALCSDGTLVSWGWNGYGQLGDNSTTNRLVPVLVNTAQGVSALYGKTVVMASAGALDNLALCADGTVVSWGWNGYGQLGDTTRTQRNVPVVVNRGPLAPQQRFTRIVGGPGFQSFAIVAAPPAAAIGLINPAKTTNGSFQFAFANTPGAFFGVLTASNPALPLSAWSPLGLPSELAPGQFQFTDLAATNASPRFYRVRSP